MAQVTALQVYGVPGMVRSFEAKANADVFLDVAITDAAVGRVSMSDAAVGRVSMSDAAVGRVSVSDSSRA